MNSVDVCDIRWAFKYAWIFIGKATVCEWRNNMEENTWEGSSFASHDIYELRIPIWTPGILFNGDLGLGDKKKSVAGIELLFELEHWQLALLNPPRPD